MRAVPPVRMIIFQCSDYKNATKPEGGGLQEPRQKENFFDQGTHK